VKPNGPLAKPAPVLPAALPGRWRMVRDLGWLLGVLFRIAPLPCSFWAVIALLQGLLVPAQLWLTRALVDALARQVRDGVARDTFLWLGLLAASLLLERALGGVTPWLQAAVRERTAEALQQRVMQRATTLDLATFEHQGYYDQLNRVIGDVETRVPRLLLQTLEGVQTLPQVLGYAFALFSLSAVLPLIVLAAVLPTVFFFALSGQTNWSLLNAQTRDRRLVGYYARLLSDRAFAKEIRLYELAGYLRTRWSSLFWQTRNEQRRLALHLGLRQRGAVLASTTVSMLGLWWVVAVRLIHTTAGGYALLFQSVQGMIHETYNLSSLLQSFGENSGYASALRAFVGAGGGGPGGGGAGGGGDGHGGGGARE
jgi:ATP-binding cassette subfamily B protein